MDALLLNLDLTIEGVLMILGGGAVLLAALGNLTGIKVLGKIADALKAVAVKIKDLAIKIGIKKKEEVKLEEVEKEKVE